MFECCCDPEPGEVRRPAHGGRPDMTTTTQKNKSRNTTAIESPRNFSQLRHDENNKNGKTQNDDEFSSDGGIDHAEKETDNKNKKEKPQKNCLALLFRCGGDDVDYAAEYERRKMRQLRRENMLVARMRGPLQELSSTEFSILSRCKIILSGSATSAKLSECVKLLLSVSQTSLSAKPRNGVSTNNNNDAGRCLLFRKYLEKLKTVFETVRTSIKENRFMIAIDACRKVKSIMDQDGIIFELVLLHQDENNVGNNVHSLHPSSSATTAINSKNAMNRNSTGNDDDEDVFPVGYSSSASGFSSNMNSFAFNGENDETFQLRKILNLFTARASIGNGAYAEAVHACCEVYGMLEIESNLITHVGGHNNNNRNSTDENVTNQQRGSSNIPNTATHAAFTSSPPPLATAKENISNHHNPLSPPKSTSAVLPPLSSELIALNHNVVSSTSPAHNPHLVLAATFSTITNLIATSSILIIRSQAKSLQAASTVTQFKQDSAFFEASLRLNNNNNNNSSLSNNLTKDSSSPMAKASIDRLGSKFTMKNGAATASSTSSTPSVFSGTNGSDGGGALQLPSPRRVTKDYFARIESAVTDAEEAISKLSLAYKLYFTTFSPLLLAQKRQNVPSVFLVGSSSSSSSSPFDSGHLNHNIDFFSNLKIGEALLLMANLQKKIIYRDWQDARQTILNDFLDAEMDIEEQLFAKRKETIDGALDRRKNRKEASEQEERLRRKKMEEYEKERGEFLRRQQQQQQQQQNFQRPPPPSSSSASSSSSPPPPPPPSPYDEKVRDSFEILGFPDVMTKKNNNAPSIPTADEVKHKYRMMSLKWHPDRWSSSASTATQDQILQREKAEEMMKKINEANQFLREKFFV